MVELYIEGRKVDLKTDVKVALNFTNTEVEYPTVIKNSFSTTVKVEGTKTNNEIFGDIWKLDRVIGGNSTIPISTNFDATKRVNFQLVDNGDVIEDGYLQLTNINYTKGMIEYSLVLYGGLGDFFYTLSYGDTDNEKTLEDLHFGWRDTLEEENTKVLGNWNRDFISRCWSKLEDNYLFQGELESDISPIPTYDGLYEDFDNNKCLVDMTSGYVPYLQTEYKNDNKTYTLYGERFGLVEMPREIVEWEAKDLRSNQQRFGLRMSTFLNAVSNPDNNGGFNVVLDDEIKDSPYYRKAYIMFGKPNFEMEDIENDYEDPVILNPFSMNFQYDDFDKTTTFSPTQLDLTNLGIPNVRLNMEINSEFGSLGYMSQNSRNNWETRREVSENGFTETECQYFWTGLLFRVEAYTTSGSYIGSTPSVLYSNNGVDGVDNKSYNRKWGSTDAGNFRTDSLNQLINALNNDNEFRSKPITEIIYQNYDKGMSNTVPLEFNQNLPYIGQQAVLRMSAYWVYSQIDQWITGGGYSSETYKGGLMKYDGNHYINYGDQWFDSTYIYEARERGGRARSLTFNVLSGEVSKSGQVKSLVFPITKKKLFGGTKSPYKYLVDFTKMFGLKYRYDRYTRTIYIEKRRNYYTGNVKSLDVDLTKGISITPTTAQSKWYSLELETPESYASLLYNKTNAVTYGNKLLGVDYEFNNDNTNLVEGNIYKNILPYRLSSYYFKPDTQLPPFMLSPSIKYSLYNEDEGLYTVEISNQWNQIKDDYGTAYQDTSTRMCLFNADNKYMSDIDNSLVFINGFEKNKNFIISDNMKEMFDMNEKPCYLFTRNPQIAIQNPDIPVFTKYSETDIESIGSFDASFDFTVPNQIFGYEGVRYNESSTIYNAFWKSYLSDLYDKNTKLVTLNAFLQHNPIEEMRDFYYFDGCYWSISKIFDYVIGGYEPTKVELVKVNDVKNYKDEYVSPVHVIYLRVEPNRPYIIPASGGFISPQTLNLPVRAYYSDGSSKVVTNFNITGNTIYGENLGKEITPMRELGTINFTVTYGGASASGTVPVMQAANEMTQSTTRNFGESEHVKHTSTESETHYTLEVSPTKVMVGNEAGSFDLHVETNKVTSTVTYEYETWYEVETRTTGYLWTSGASDIVTEEINTGAEQRSPVKEVSRSEQSTPATLYIGGRGDYIGLNLERINDTTRRVTYIANSKPVQLVHYLQLLNYDQTKMVEVEIIQESFDAKLESMEVVPRYVPDIPARGGSVSPDRLSFTVTCHYEGGYTRVVNDYTVTGNTVTADNLEKTLTSRREVGQINYVVTYDNLSVSGSTPIYQQENIRTEVNRVDYGESEHTKHTYTTSSGPECNITCDPMSINAGWKEGSFRVNVNVSKDTTITEYEYETWYKTEIITRGYEWTSGATETQVDTVVTGDQIRGENKVIGTRTESEPGTFSVASTPDWVTVTSSTSTSVSFNYSANNEPNGRNGSIIFRCDDGIHETQLVIYQESGRSFYIEFTPYKPNVEYEYYTISTPRLRATLKLVQDEVYSYELPTSLFTKSSITNGMTVESLYNEFLSRFNKEGQFSFTLTWDADEILEYVREVGELEGDGSAEFKFNIKPYTTDEGLFKYQNISLAGYSKNTIFDNTLHYKSYGSIIREDNGSSSIEHFYAYLTIPEAHYKNGDIIDSVYITVHYEAQGVPNMDNPFKALGDFEFSADMFTMDISDICSSDIRYRELKEMLRSLKPIGFQVNASNLEKYPIYNPVTSVEMLSTLAPYNLTVIYNIEGYYGVQLLEMLMKSYVPNEYFVFNTTMKFNDLYSFSDTIEYTTRVREGEPDPTPKDEVEYYITTARVVDTRIDSTGHVYFQLANNTNPIYERLPVKYFTPTVVDDDYYEIKVNDNGDEYLLTYKKTGDTQIGFTWNGQEILDDLGYSGKYTGVEEYIQDITIKPIN